MLDEKIQTSFVYTEHLAQNPNMVDLGTIDPRESDLKKIAEDALRKIL